MRRLRLLVACTVVGLGLVTAGPEGAEAAKYTIKVANAGPNNPDNRTVMAVDMFKRMVESQTKGDIEVRAYHASSLGNEREALEGVKIGTIEMATLSSGPVPGFFAPVMVFSIPYLFSSAPLAWDVFNGPFGRDFSEAMRKQTGIRVLGITENGFRHFTTGSRPLKKPEDLKGLKFRTMENPAHMAMVRAFGADPTPIAFGELYMALQQKVVDGQETPVALINQMKFYEVQKYAILDGHVYDPLFVFANDKFFNSLPLAYQNIVFDNARLLTAAHNGFSAQQNLQGVDDLRKRGMEVYVPSPDELESFKKIAQPPALKFVEERAGKEWVTKILKAVADAEEHLRIRK
jgi:C4-dicarboxylate-binding protein DctP